MVTRIQSTGLADDYFFATHVPSSHDCVQQSALEWQLAPRPRHWTGCRLVAPGSTFVVFDELKQAMETSPGQTGRNSAGGGRIPLEKAKWEPAKLGVPRAPRGSQGRTEAAGEQGANWNDFAGVLGVGGSAGRDRLTLHGVSVVALSLLPLELFGPSFERHSLVAYGVANHPLRVAADFLRGALASLGGPAPRDVCAAAQLICIPLRLR